MAAQELTTHKDITIAIIGETGVGKSTLGNKMLGKNDAFTVGHE